jgi:hypothetical protein
MPMWATCVGDRFSGRSPLMLRVMLIVDVIWMEWQRNGLSIWYVALRLEQFHQ